jgi:hypothetical protein
MKILDRLIENKRRKDNITEEVCNGICLTSYDIGVPEAGYQIAHAHPECFLHSPETAHELYKEMKRYVRKQQVRRFFTLKRNPYKVKKTRG